jgi:acetyl-CoA synthetase
MPRACARSPPKHIGSRSRRISPGTADSAELRTTLSQAVVDAVGAIARPARVVVVTSVPRTRNGKIMRRVLRDLMVTGNASGDLTSLENPDAIDVVLKKLAEP